MNINYTNILLIIFVVLSIIYLYIRKKKSKKTNKIRDIVMSDNNTENLNAAKLFILTDLSDLTSEITDITSDGLDDIEDIKAQLISNKLYGGSKEPNNLEQKKILK